MGVQTVENILDAAERLSFIERLTLMQRLLDGLKRHHKPQNKPVK